MRQRQLKWLWRRLAQLSTMRLKREELLMKLGAARAKAPAAWRLVDIEVAAKEAAFSYRLDRRKLRQVRRREGRYLLRTNLSAHDPAQLWQFYIQLVEIEAAFKTLKDDLGLRPIYHQLEQRIEAHIFVAFMAYCLHVTLRARLRPLAAGLTPRAVLDKLAAIQMLDVHFPTADRPHPDPVPLHRAQRRSAAPHRAPQPDIAAAAASADHRGRPTRRLSHHHVVETF